MTIDEVVKQVLAGETYDMALPQAWMDDVVQATGVRFGEVARHFVWAYDRLAGLAGRPCALTQAGNRILERYNMVRALHFPLTPRPAGKWRCGECRRIVLKMEAPWESCMSCGANEWLRESVEEVG